MIKPISIFVFGLIFICFCLFFLSVLFYDSSITAKVISGKVTGNAILDGELVGLELSVLVPEKYQNVEAGEDFRFQTEIKNLKNAGRYDIQLDYFIKKNEIVVNQRRELKAVETQASFLSSINVPEETLPGIYDIIVEVNEEESAGATFYVKSNEIGQIKTYLIILIVAIVIVGGLIFFELHMIARKRR